MPRSIRIEAQNGFTLIELMVVVAILAILLSIAVPTYQNYSIRAQNSECLSVAAPAKEFVSETVQSQGIVIDNGSADLSGWAPPPATARCSSVEVEAATGVVTVTTNVAGTSGEFILTPTQANGSDAIEWTCTAPGVPANHAPATCRGS